MRAPDGTLVFVEVRQRSNASHGGAGTSIGTAKQRRIIFAARHYLIRSASLPVCQSASLPVCQSASLPPCRFDVVLVHGALSGERGAAQDIERLPAAFDAS